MSRRAFLAKSAVAASVLAFIQGCGDGQIGPPALTAADLAANPLKVTLADYPGLATPGTLVRIQDSTVGVIRTGDTTFAANSTICTHEGCDTTVTNNQYFCLCHGSLFSSNGTVLRGPANQPLPSFTTSLDTATGVLTIS